MRRGHFYWNQNPNDGAGWLTNEKVFCGRRKMISLRKPKEDNKNWKKTKKSLNWSKRTKQKLKKQIPIAMEAG